QFVTKFINQTNRSIFLTGKAGTGKTTLLRKIIASTHKKAAIVAPTGIAAINAGGVTIHSMFQLPFAAFIPDFKGDLLVGERVKFESKDSLVKHFKFAGKRRELLITLELLIIDEVSMLRADLLDAIDWTLRSIRKRNESFGGVQVLFIGDLLQLPPVVKSDEWSELRNYYQGIYFFHAHVVQQFPPIYIELNKVYRQEDQNFIELLNHLRNNRIDQDDLKLLANYVKPDFDAKQHTGYITLTTHNIKADTMNSSALNALTEKSHFYSAEVNGEFPPHMFPLEEQLELKIGAQVMFIKNDLSIEKRYFNGKTGVVKSLSSQEIIVYFPDDKSSIEVDKYEWQNIRYSVDPMTKEIKEEVLGTFIHYPLKLAWAITIHKSQGLTFDKAVLDVSNVFAPGQAYVALSRLRSLDGLVLLAPLQMNGLSNDQQVMQYASTKAEASHLLEVLEEDTIEFLKNYLLTAFDWRDMATKWRIHEASYGSSASKSEKSKHALWAARQSKVILDALEPSQKFVVQLTNLFSVRPLNLQLISERVAAANNYFMKSIEGSLMSVMAKKEEVKRIKKIKSYYEELEEIEEALFELIAGLKRSFKLVQLLLENKEFTKDAIWSDDLLYYRKELLNRVKSELQPVVTLMDYTEEEEAMINKRVASSKNTTTKKAKKSTYEITYEMLKEGKTISQISAERVMSESTIFSHLTNLIKQQQLSINEILDENRIKELEVIFEDYTDTSLTPLKEQVGDAFSWEELRLFKASKQVQSLENQ
ncbi:MAG: helicase, partial [Crocinitomicaceae bacterium]|nr:helicase [Crocinitomicaceae bacterium]